MKETTLPNITMEHKRDAYGFAVRPQHLQTYRKYADIYKEEEEQRSNRWKDFLGRHTESNQLPSSGESPISSLEETDGNHKDDEERDSDKRGEEKEAQIRTSLAIIEQMMSSRMKKDLVRTEEYVDRRGGHLASREEAKHSEDSEDEFYDVEKSDLNQEVSSSDSSIADSPGVHDIQGAAAAAHEEYFPWKKELESLVHDGLPMALRGELWQAFVGVRKRRVEGYYNNLLNLESDDIDSKVVDASHLNKNANESEKCQVDAPEKWKGELEKDLPRTFPGHPALHENGRNALRQLLTAYARHNPSVGYCQPMNYLAGLLLLLMPEENAFWTLVGIMDDYFDGYYSEEMIESQVDQLVLEELVRERLPKLVNHLDYLGFQMVWVTGPWFLSMFLNVLPWESVMRVWDVLLFDGSRAMLFRTTLALMELYGPALVTTKNTGSATNLLQSLAGSTFDSSQLIFTACMGCEAVSELRLGDLRKKHRPVVLADLEKSKGLHAWRNSHGLASKLYCFRRGPELLTSANSAELSSNMHSNEDLHLSVSDSKNIDEFLNRMSIDTKSDSVTDLKEQVMWLKVGLCRLLEEKRLATLRAEEFETALMEMVEQDNRRLLSAKVEQLEQEIFESRLALKDKQEQEQAMLQVLMRVEQEQKVTEDARSCTEQDVVAQKYATHLLQEKYEEILASLAQMEKRAIIAETTLEATLQPQSSHAKAQPPRTPTLDHSAARVGQETSRDFPTRTIGLLSRPFGLGWRDKNKSKPSNAEESVEGKATNSNGQSLSTSHDKDVMETKNQKNNS